MRSDTDDPSNLSVPLNFDTKLLVFNSYSYLGEGQKF